MHVHESIQGKIQFAAYEVISTQITLRQSLCAAN